MNRIAQSLLFGLVLLIGAAVIADAQWTRVNGIDVAPTLMRFVGVDSTFPALKRNATAVEVRLADDSAYAPVRASAFSPSANLLISGTAPTISSGFGSTPSASITANNGTAAFLVNVGGGGVATSGVIGLPTAATGWVVYCDDMTTPGVNETKQTATATNTATVTNYNTTTGGAAAWGAQDILRCIAMAY